MDMDITFREFLLWLQYPGIEVAVGVLTSIAAEYVPQFVKLERKWKMPVILAFNVGVPVLAAGVSAVMGYQPLDFDATFWPALVAGVLAFAGGQANWIRYEVVRLKRLMSRFDRMR